jgi:hypothetical protein
MNPFFSGIAGGLAGAANKAANSGGWNFLDMLKGAGGWLLGADKSGTPNWMNAAGLAGGLYSGLQQQKAANKALKMQQDAFDFNKMLSQREIDRQNRAEQNLYDGWNASTFAR